MNLRSSIAGSFDQRRGMKAVEGRWRLYTGAMSSIDEIIEIYKRDVDWTLIEENLKRSVQERIEAMEQFNEFIGELRAGVAEQRDAIR